MSRLTIARTGIALAVTLGTLGLAAPAQASTPGCVVKAEYTKVHKGYSTAQVKKIFGTGGKRMSYATSGGYSAEVRTYTACSEFSSIAISYSNGRLAAKAAVWVY